MPSSDLDAVRQSIISSLFSPNSKGSAGQTGQVYISHCKTWEDSPGGGDRKPRYILLAVGSTGHVFLHKSKRNANGSFSIGKTWDIQDLRSVELIDDSTFHFVIGQRSYTWFAENLNERNKFINLLIRSFRQFTQGDLPDLVGLPNDDYSSPAYPHIPPSDPFSSLPSSSNSRTRPLNAPTSPGPTQQSSSHTRPLNPSQSTFRSTSPNSTPNSVRAGPSHSTPAPSSHTHFSNNSLPGLSIHNGPQRVHNPAQSSSAIESPLSSPKHSLQIRSYPDEESRVVGASSTPQKSSRPKVTMVGLALNSRSNVRTGSSTPDSPVANRMISSPLRPNQDRPPTRDQRPSGEPLESVRKYSIDDAQGPAMASNLKPVRQSPKKSSSSKIPAAESRTAQPSNLNNLSSETKFDIPGALSNIEEHSSSSPKIPATETRTSQPSHIKNQSGETNFDIPEVLSNVEEILEGFHWQTIPSHSTREQLVSLGGPEPVSQIEQQLMSELKALELAEIHAIIENDDRVGTIVTYLDESLAELDKMEALLSLYRTQLNIVDDDIAHIESHNRGLQVQISSQRVLLEEIENIMQTIRIPDVALDALTKEPLDSQKGIDQLEKAATSLYKAILSVQDLNNVAAVAAASEDKVAQYKRNCQQFCKRVYEFLIVMFKYQAELILNDKNNRKLKNEMKLPSHSSMEKYLERYCGLTLFVKEMDAPRYQQLCASYFTTASELHKSEIMEVVMIFRNTIRKPNDDELDATFAAQFSPTATKTMAPRNPLSKFEKRDKKDAHSIAEVATAGEALQNFLIQLVPHVQQEQNFVIDFLHVHSVLEDGDALITYAGYSGLQGYFKRAAINHVQNAMVNNKFNDILSVMDLIFGFLPGEIKEWVEQMVAVDPMHIVSVMLALDSILGSATLARSEFLTKILEGQQRRSLNLFEQNVKEQLKAIETTRLTVKKRKGVVSFISTFPEFVQRVERQFKFIDSADSPTRKLVDQLYGKIVQSMFEALQTMAKSESDPAINASNGSQEDRDKHRLNYHTLILENMHHFVTTVLKIDAPALKGYLEKAKEQYDHNLASYIRLVLRRPLARFLDYFQGIEELLRTTEPSQIPQHSQYTRASLKRVISSLDKKDMKKAIESLSKRVDKHFNDLANPSAENSVVMETVWRACEKESIRLINDWQAVLDKCYGTSGSSNDNGSITSGSGSTEKVTVKFEFTVDDVKYAFQKYRPGS